MAWLLARYRFPGRAWLNALVHLPLVLPPVVTGWLLLIMFGIRGPIGSLLFEWFGIRLVFTTAGASLACAVMTFPVMVRSVRLSLEAVDPGLDQAARTLGAGRLDRLFNVTCRWPRPVSWWARSSALPPAWVNSARSSHSRRTFPGRHRPCRWPFTPRCKCRAAKRKPRELSLVSLTLALIGLLLSEWVGRRLNAGTWQMSLSVRLRHDFRLGADGYGVRVPRPA